MTSTKSPIRPNLQSGVVQAAVEKREDGGMENKGGQGQNSSGIDAVEANCGGSEGGMQGGNESQAESHQKSDGCDPKEQEEDEEEAEEAQRPMLVTSPDDPTQEERDLHDATHLPPRSWCRVCLEARAREDGHFRQGESRKAQGVPIISLDYAFIDHKDSEQKNGIVVMKCHRTKYTFSHVVENKGSEAGMSETVNQLVRDIESLGYKQVILQCDAENSIKDLRNTIIRKRIDETLYRDVAKGQSQSNGVVERGIQSIENQMRCIKLGLEKRIGCRIQPDWDVMHWIVELAGVHISRFEKGRDGMTPYRRLTGREWKFPIVEMGEVVMYKELRSKSEKRNVANEKAHVGIWIGVSPDSKEHIIGTPEGVIKARTIWRRPYSERWNKDMVESMRGTPLRPDPSSNSSRIPVRIRMTFPEMPLPEEIPPANKEVSIRRMRITKSDHEAHGYTDGCPGCYNHRMGLCIRQHTEECRKRIMEEQRKTGTGFKKQQAETERIAKFCEEELRQNEKSRQVEEEEPNEKEEASTDTGRPQDGQSRQAPASSSSSSPSSSSPSTETPSGQRAELGKEEEEHKRIRSS